jgi:hypothetical protein
MRATRNKPIILLLALGLVATPARAGDESETNRIVYWGNSSNGKSVRVFNTADAEKKAEAQVKALGGPGWTLLENSTTPGFGAAICERKGSTHIFYTAHGYASGREAVTAAKVKSNGRGYFCSNALWRVNETMSGPPRDASVIETIQGLIRKTIPAKRCDWQPTGPTPSARPLPQQSDEAPGSSCPPPDPKARSFKTRYVCMCVRG